MKSARRHEQYVVGFDHAVTSVDRCSFDDWKNVTLTPFPRNIGSLPTFSSSYLVYFIEEDYSGRFDAFDRKASDLIHIDQLLLLFLDEIFHCFVNAHLSRLRPAAKHVGKHVAKIDIHLFDALRRVDLEMTRILSLLNLELNHTRAQASFP